MQTEVVRIDCNDGHFKKFSEKFSANSLAVPSIVSEEIEICTTNPERDGQESCCSSQDKAERTSPRKVKFESYFETVQGDHSSQLRCSSTDDDSSESGKKLAPPRGLGIHGISPTRKPREARPSSDKKESRERSLSQRRYGFYSGSPPRMSQDTSPRFNFYGKAMPLDLSLKQTSSQKSGVGMNRSPSVDGAKKNLMNPASSSSVAKASSTSCGTCTTSHSNLKIPRDRDTSPLKRKGSCAKNVNIRSGIRGAALITRDRSSSPLKRQVTSYAKNDSIRSAIQGATPPSSIPTIDNVLKPSREKTSKVDTVTETDDNCSITSSSSTASQCVSSALEALINFAYTGKVVFDKSNVQSIMMGASYLQLIKVRDACANFLLQGLHPQNAIGIKHFAETLGCKPLADSADKYIEVYFHEVSQNEEFLNLSLNDIKCLLNKNELRVESEEQVFEACMRWIKHKEERKEHVAELLTYVRLPLLSPVYITDRVGTEDLIRYSLQCRDLLDEARTYHLIPERRALIQSFKTEARDSEVKGNIYVVGGLNKHGDSLSTVEYYDPRTVSWTMAPPMSMLRSRLGVAVLRSKLYAFGGYNGKDRLASVEVYDAVRKEWSPVAPMQCKRSALGATALGDTIYVCGGYDGVTSLNSVEMFHPPSGTWCSLAPMNKSRSAGAVIACQGFIYALGGHDGLSIFDSVEKYDPNSNTWTEAAAMLTKRCRLGVAILGGKLYACGGYDGSTFLQTVEMYDPLTNKWTYVAPMNAQRSRVALTANMGKLWAVGGYDGISNLVSVEVYDPKTDTWTYAAPMVAHEGGVGLGVISLP